MDIPWKKCDIRGLKGDIRGMKDEIPWKRGDIRGKKRDDILWKRGDILHGARKGQKRCVNKSGVASFRLRRRRRRRLINSTENLRQLKPD